MIPTASQAISLLTNMNGAGGTLSDCGCIQQLPSCIFNGMDCVDDYVVKKNRALIPSDINSSAGTQVHR